MSLTTLHCMSDWFPLNKPTLGPLLLLTNINQSCQSQTQNYGQLTAIHLIGLCSYVYRNHQQINQTLVLSLSHCALVKPISSDHMKSKPKEGLSSLVNRSRSDHHYEKQGQTVHMLQLFGIYIHMQKNSFCS